MKKLILSFFLLLAVCLNISRGQSAPGDWIFQPEDKRLAEEKLNFFSTKQDMPISELIAEIGLSFSGTTYVAATLENGIEEKLVINLRELDCTTFAENCLALARTVKQHKTDFNSFVAELERIRYRDGIRNQYPSRLHYFSEWVSNNHKKGIVSDMPNQSGEKMIKAINFMSLHPSSYPVLKEHPELVPVIAAQEKVITQTGFMYFPGSNPSNLYQHLQHGDIIALTSSIEGIDVNHVGIILKKDGEFYLLHASLSGKKVLVSDDPITGFIKPGSKNNGIIIARPVF